MILAKKIRLYPTNTQEKQLWQSVGTARFVYNWVLAKQEENYKQGNRFIQDGALRKELTQLKQTEEYKWLYEVSNNIAKQAVKDACIAYKRFFNKQANKPRFKNKKKSKPSFYNDNIKLKIKEKLVLIEKVGWIKTKEQIPMEGKYTNPRVSFDGKYWYLSVGTERELDKVELTGEAIGIDIGISELAVCSNGLRIPNINKSNKVKKIEKKLKRLQRKVSNKYEKNKEGRKLLKTKNILKLEKQIKLIHRKLKNIRLNHIHQATTKIVKTKPSKIVIENLNVSGMMKNKHLSKVIANQGLYEFRRQLEYKTKIYGIELIVADRFYPSSKLCSSCKTHKADLKLKDRVYKCDCGLVIDRDYNASLNLMKLAI